MVDAITGMSGKLAPANKTSAPAVGRGAAAGAKEPSKASSDSTSVVNLSPEAASSLVKTLSSEPPVDSGKVTRIKAAIANGDYPVDIDKITDSLMEYHKIMR